ncbi:MAG: hypothetical protein WBA87_16110 [Microbacterium sp.]|jgi:hypothetical protein
MIIATVLTLSGCAMPNIVTDARNASIRNAAKAFSEAVDCFGKLQITKGEDLDALARQNGLCGDWLTLGATDEELAVWSWTLGNDTALIRIDESTGVPIIKVLTAGQGRANAWTQWEDHTLIACWQVRLDLSGKKPEVTEFECPQQWLESWGAAEVMTLKELKEAAEELGVAVIA